MVASRLGALSLVPLGQAFASSSDPTVQQLLGETIYEGLVRTAYSIHMLFYCAGGLIWYALFYRLRCSRSRLGPWRAFPIRRQSWTRETRSPVHLALLIKQRLGPPSPYV